MSCLALALGAAQGGCGGGAGEDSTASVGGQAGAAQGGSAGTGGDGGLSQGGVAGEAPGGSGGHAEGGASQGGSGGSGLSGSAGSPSALSCPPSGPYGSALGDVVRDVTLYDCDGSAVSLHDLCQAPVSVVYTFAAWCPVCRSHMESGRPNQLLAAHRAGGLEEWVVVTEKTDGSSADAQLCQLTRDTYSLTPKVLFDPDDALHELVGLQVNSGGLVMTQGGRIELKVGYDFDAVESKVESLLGR